MDSTIHLRLSNPEREDIHFAMGTFLSLPIQATPQIHQGIVLRLVIRLYVLGSGQLLPCLGRARPNRSLSSLTSPPSICTNTIGQGVPPCHYTILPRLSTPRRLVLMASSKKLPFSLCPSFQFPLPRFQFPLSLDGRLRQRRKKGGEGKQKGEGEKKSKVKDQISKMGNPQS